MKVFVISLRKLLYGSAVGVGLVLAIVLVIWKDPLHVATLFQFDRESMETTAKVADNPFASERPQVAMDVQVENNEIAVNLITTGFTFTEEQSNAEQKLESMHGKGHAHLYVDGRMIQKIYQPQFTIKNMPKGEHELKIELAYPNHLSYKVETVKILQIK
ncbi:MULTISPECIES: hypothetical protein [Brevibacillus]|uniref:Uncharacterized protein n=1 Tax=Brevibacillus laterosporus LMG 15441 TaxID=1042163 RepID=A0A075R563_BRELA|nr:MULTISPECIES: hypothetical protein [Brevibacillus]AIG26308.1 hypothetical protein BRLA_c019870 [Brevibacillus laterosporus LMG 15441]AUM64886.1 hypothetical protein C0R09_10260 [Brevibacillus laterosporus]AYK07883.1 hypothetical protein D8Z77_16710 [Brevibacillus laterosporus]MBA4534782.1 hypothetical protein [Brevibacillus halotolerans]MCR8964570.1 hypothetical protein [Brevibacillus laterosporus]